MTTERRTERAIHLTSRAPTRIDLAGGTVDLWPLHLFLDRPVTLNLGIDLFAEAELDAAPASGTSAIVVMRSEDQGIEASWPFDQPPADAEVHPALALHIRFFRFFSKGMAPHRLKLTTRAKSPAGAGLGGSSTLSIAIVGALSTWQQGRPLDPVSEGERYIEIVRDVETTVIQVPAGVQDYYGAMYGGLQSLRWGFGAHEREWLPENILRELEQRLLLFYSGQSRNSGINNWALFKGFIDSAGGKSDSGVRAQFARINAATQALEKALRAQDWKAAGQAIADEWATRRTLAPGIATPEIDAAFEAARAIAPVSGKVCGAGGGGCFFLYLPEADESLRKKITEACVSRGVRALPFKAVSRGLEVNAANRVGPVGERPA